MKTRAISAGPYGHRGRISRYQARRVSVREFSREFLRTRSLQKTEPRRGEGRNNVTRAKMGKSYGERFFVRDKILPGFSQKMQVDAPLRTLRKLRISTSGNSAKGRNKNLMPIYPGTFLSHAKFFPLTRLRAPRSCGVAFIARDSSRSTVLENTLKKRKILFARQNEMDTRASNARKTDPRSDVACTFRPRIGETQRDRNFLSGFWGMITIAIVVKIRYRNCTRPWRTRDI